MTLPLTTLPAEAPSESLPIVASVTVPSVPVAHVAYYGKRIAIYPGPNTTIPSYLFPQGTVSFNVLSHPNAFTVPFDLASKIPSILLERFPNERITMEGRLREEIERILSIERKSASLSSAEDADVEPNVLSLTPRNFQNAAIAFGQERESFILSLDMGLGKSLVATFLAESRNLPTLWVTKAALVINLKREIFKLTGKVACVMSGRMPTDEDLKAFLSGKFDHYIINYEVIGTEIKETKDGAETITRPWPDLFNMMSHLGRIKQIVADEAHACKSTTALRTKSLLALKAPYRIPMTGTAIVNRVGELWTLLHWIDPLRFPSQQGFVDAHCDGDGNIRNPRQFQKEIAPYLFRRRTLDVIKELPGINRITHTVSLSPSHAERYRAALDMVFLALDGSEKEINNALVQLNRLREIMADAKVEDTIEYVNNLLEEDPDTKVLIFSNFKAPAKTIALRLGGESINGDVTQTERMNMVDRFQNDPKRKILTLTVPVGQEGLTLTAAHHVVFNDLAWTPKDHNQAEGRAYARLNDLHGITSTYLEIAGTADAILRDILATKQAIIDSVDGLTEGMAQEDSVIGELLRRLREMR